MKTRHPHLARNFIITYAAVLAGLSVFSLWPSMALGEFSTLLITMFWMVVLGGIVTSYAVIAVTFGGDHEESVGEGADLGQPAEA